MNREEKNRIVNAAVSKLSFAKPEKKSPEDELIDKAMQMSQEVYDHITPVLQAGGWKDRKALSALIHGAFMERLGTRFSKDELVVLCTLLHSQTMLERVDAQPWGPNSKPDLLS